MQESQIGLRNAKEREKNVKELTKSYKNDEEKVATSNEHWKNGTSLIMGISGQSTVSGLMAKKMSRNRKVKIRLFPGAKIKDMFHYAIPLLEKLIMSLYMSAQMMHHTKLVQIFRMKYWN